MVAGLDFGQHGRSRALAQKGNRMLRCFFGWGGVGFAPVLQRLRCIRPAFVPAGL